MSKGKIICLAVLGIIITITPQQLKGSQNTEVLNFYTPFMEPARDKYSSIYQRTISTYGGYRSSYLKGHKHAGIDLKGSIGEKVYSIAIGEVVDIQLSFPNLSVIVKHNIPGKDPVYSRYTHVEDVQVIIGNKVDKNTCLGRLFNSREFKRSGFGVNHLHIEIRKSITDNCSASWMSLTMEDLNKYCMDPLIFYKKVLK